MTTKEAHNILHIYGLYLQHQSGKVSLLFSADIPEFFLPYPKKKLQEAFAFICNDPISNERTKVLAKECMMDMWQYNETEEAIIRASDNFSNSEWRKAMLPALKEFSLDWIKLIEEENNI
jgi:hypothetical protein